MMLTAITIGEVRRLCLSQVVCVALDENGQPPQVPSLKAITPEEINRIQKAWRERTRQLEAELDSEFH